MSAICALSASLTTPCTYMHWEITVGRPVRQRDPMEAGLFKLHQGLPVFASMPQRIGTRISATSRRPRLSTMRSRRVDRNELNSITRSMHTICSTELGNPLGITADQSTAFGLGRVVP